MAMSIFKNPSRHLIKYHGLIFNFISLSSSVLSCQGAQRRNQTESGWKSLRFPRRTASFTAETWHIRESSVESLAGSSWRARASPAQYLVGYVPANLNFQETLGCMVDGKTAWMLWGRVSWLPLNLTHKSLFWLKSLGVLQIKPSFPPCSTSLWGILVDRASMWKTVCRLSRKMFSSRGRYLPTIQA